MPECQRCHHDSHAGQMCWHYNTATIRDDVTIGAVPCTGETRTVLESVCRCVSLAVMPWPTTKTSLTG